MLYNIQSNAMYTTVVVDILQLMPLMNRMEGGLMALLFLFLPERYLFQNEVAAYATGIEGVVYMGP